LESEWKHGRIVTAEDVQFIAGHVAQRDCAVCKLPVTTRSGRQLQHQQQAASDHVAQRSVGLSPFSRLDSVRRLAPGSAAITLRSEPVLLDQTSIEVRLKDLGPIQFQRSRWAST